MEFGWERRTYLSSALLPGMKRLVRSVHSLLGLRRATVCYSGYLLPCGRVQHGEHRGCGDPAAVYVALRPQQRSGDIQAVVSVHGGGQAGEDLPEEAASLQHTESGHAGAECVCVGRSLWRLCVPAARWPTVRPPAASRRFQPVLRRPRESRDRAQNTTGEAFRVLFCSTALMRSMSNIQQPVSTRTRG